MSNLALPAPARGFGRDALDRWLASPGFLTWVFIGAVAAIVLPPMFFLLQTALTVGRTGTPTRTGFDNFLAVLQSGGFDVWWVTLAYAGGSSLVAIVLGVTSALLVARTNTPFRQAALIGAFLSMAAPVIIKGIGWILLLGPNRGLLNVWLRELVGGEQGPIMLYTLPGMIFIEGVLWTPIVFLLTLPPLMAMDPSLEEAAATSGVGVAKTFRLVTLPLAKPSIIAVFLLTFIRALESFEVPLLIGTPGGLHTFTTIIYQSIHSGLLPNYGEASAFAILLLLLVAVPLAFYYRMTRRASKFATVTGKGFRPRRVDLGAWRYPCALVLLVIPLSLAAPLLIMLWASFVPIYLVPSAADLAKFSLANYISVLTRPDTLGGLWNTLWVSTASATAVAGLCFVLAWIVVRGRSPARWGLDALASLPLVFPGIVLGIAVMVQFLKLPQIPLYGTIGILVFAFLIKFMPFGMRFCHAGVLAIHAELEECGRTSGAKTATVLRKIVLPLALPAVVGAWLYVFLHAMRDLSIAVLLSGPGNHVISAVILDLWDKGEIPELAAVSVMLAAVAVALGTLFMRYSQRHSFRT